MQWIMNNLAILNEMMSSVTVGLIDIFLKDCASSVVY